MSYASHVIHSSYSSRSSSSCGSSAVNTPTIIHDSCSRYIGYSSHVSHGSHGSHIVHCSCSGNTRYAIHMSYIGNNI